MTPIELQKEIVRLAAMVSAPQHLLPRIAGNPIEGELVVVFNGDTIKLIFKERGHNIEYMSSKNPDDVLYCAFSQIALSMSMMNSSRWHGWINIRMKSKQKRIALSITMDL